MNKAAGANGRQKTVGATATRRRGYRRRKPDNETATGLEILEPAAELRVRCRSTKWLGRAFSSDADLDRSRGGKCSAKPFGDRKSTSMNSSHTRIAYAVSCVTEKKSTS